MSRLIRLRLPHHLSPFPVRGFSAQNSSSNVNEITDHEWNLRTGRAIFVLRETMPSFFSTGLVATTPSQSSPPLSDINANADTVSDSADVESIYSDHIRLLYTPPTALPTPFPRTLRVDGLPLYMASAVFVRHTVNALYASPSVELRKLAVNDGAPEQRERSLVLSLAVRATTRVSGTSAQWDVHSTYTFSPQTGLVATHTVDSICPAPHEAVWDAVRAGLGRVLGLGAAVPEVEGRAGAMCGERKS